MPNTEHESHIWARMTYGMDRCLRLVREMRIKYKAMEIGKKRVERNTQEKKPI